MTPFQALYGRSLPSLVPYTSKQSNNATIDLTLTNKEAILFQIKETLKQTRQQMEDQANKHRSDMHFNLGDNVYVRLQAYRQVSVTRRSSHKLL